MFKSLLVPLDGSQLAEAALSAARRMAEALGAEVTLLHVIERDAPGAVHGDRHLTNPAEAEAYLAQTAQRAFPPGVPVATHIHTSAVADVAASITEHVGELGRPDLIVLSTHGSGGLKGMLFGSIAQQVVAQGHTPVLVVQPEGGATNDFACGKILVPLDGNPEHEEGICIAAELAQRCGGELYLLQVIPTVGTLSGERAATARLLPGVTGALLDLQQAEAEAYLRGHCEALLESGQPVHAAIRRGDPVKVITEVAQQSGADLLVLSTHGLSRMDAFWSGSVTPRLASALHLPMLLVPVAE